MAGLISHIGPIIHLKLKFEEFRNSYIFVTGNDAEPCCHCDQLQSLASDWCKQKLDETKRL